jgi:hypothetical protein
VYKFPKKQNTLNMVGGANPAKHTRSKKKETVVSEEDNENEATVQTETEPPGDDPPSDGTNKPETYENSDAEDGDDEEDEQEKPVTVKELVKRYMKKTRQDVRDIRATQMSNDSILCYEK